MRKKSDEMAELKSLLARLDERSVNVERSIEEIKEKLETGYVGREEFKPIRLVVYGLVGVILVAFVTGVIALLTTK